MSKKKYDFGGMATTEGLLCDDGVIIGHGAFDDQDGMTVPLCWQHRHDSPENTLGHATLIKKDNGMYCLCSFNNNPQAQAAKEALKNGDIDALSIFANKLTKKNNVVTHGTIREVSLVYAGANPGAKIDFVDICHSTDGVCLVHSSLDENTGYQIPTDQAIIHSGYKIDYLNNESEVENNMRDNEMISLTREELNEAIYHGAAAAMAAKEEEDNQTIKEVFDTLTPKQKEAVTAIIALALQDADDESEIKQSAIYDHAYDAGYDKGIDDMKDYIAHNGVMEMKQNAFDYQDNDYIMHSSLEEARKDILSSAKRCGSFKQAYNDYVNDQDFLAHAAATGITNIGYLFPEVQLVGDKPAIIKEDDAWVKVVMDGVAKQNFSRIKTIGVDMTQAIGKGYVKGALKTNITLSALKRETYPTMIYAKADLDRQDVIEITDFNIINVLKQGIEVALRAIVAQQILFSDQRDDSDPDKIKNDCVRPIAFDDEVYTIRKTITLANDATGKVIADTFRHTVLEAMKDYKGSDNKIFFTTRDLMMNMLLAQDTLGHDMYENENKLAIALNTTKIVPVNPMSTAKYIDSTNKKFDILAIIVDLKDYIVSLPKGGELTHFEDFDINYNQMIYLTETYMAGALIRPYSAIVIQKESAADENVG